MPLIDAPCDPWPVEMSCCSGWLEASDGTPVQDAQLAEQALAVRWATNLLWKRTRRRYGVCPVTLFICPPCDCGCAPCTCGPKSMLKIAEDRPVVEITAITDVCANTVLPATFYSIVDSRYIGLNGQLACSWTAGLGCELKIEAKVGYTPDDEAIGAVSELACERMKQCTGQTCRLPASAKNWGAYKRGVGGRRDVMLTGLPNVDSFILDATAVSPSWMIDPAKPFPYVTT